MKIGIDRGNPSAAQWPHKDHTNVPWASYTDSTRYLFPCGLPTDADASSVFELRATAPAGVPDAWESTAQGGRMSPKEETMDLIEHRTASAVARIPRKGSAECRIRDACGDNIMGALNVPHKESTDPGMTPSSHCPEGGGSVPWHF